MNFSKACCTLPPVEAQHTPKGKYIEIAGLKTYHSGPSSAKTAIIMVYDVFGFAPQTVQGADILAGSTNGPQPFQVFLPDFMQGKVAKPEWFNGSEEGKKARNAFFQPGGGANIAESVELVKKFVAALNEGEFKGIEKLGIVGYCWGAKIASLVSTEGTSFSAAAHCHPSFTAVEDGSNITIPIAVLASKDEDKALIKGFVDNLKVPHHFDTYEEMPHGWMAARGDATNDPGKREYIRGYTALLNFFHEHLST